ncbi:MAG: hypothetical protein HeimC2_44780 [Candidatus Heimdallarchaeota archaeon LC_2]|nr:MAG: hypothetical protein HeimC2_44780 [Candidatus Heimdallarchaeota archaeon LC_2]
MDSQDFVYNTKNESISQKKLTSISIVIILFFTFFIFAGGIYIEVMAPALRGGENGKPFLIYPHTDHQFLVEGVLASLLIFIGFLGLFLIYRASEFGYHENRYLYQILGFTLTGSSLLILQYMFNQKL